MFYPNTLSCQTSNEAEITDLHFFSSLQWFVNSVFSFISVLYMFKYINHPKSYYYDNDLTFLYNLSDFVHSHHENIEK